MELRLLSPPEEGPIALEEARAHLRVDSTAEDYIIEAMLEAAVQHVETLTNRALMPQVWSATFPSAPYRDWCRRAPLRLPKAPLLGVTAVETLDPAGVTSVVASTGYSVATPSGPTAGAGWLTWADGVSYPDGRLRVTFRAGYARAEAVPAALRAAALLILGDLFENREGGSQGRAYVVNPTVERLLRPFLVLWP